MNRRASNPQYTLKPQDFVVVLKLCVLEPDAAPSYRELAPLVGLTKSEIGAGFKRLKESGLLAEIHGRLQPIREHVAEFAIHGARFAFPPVRGGITRGMPTAWGAPVLQSHIASAPDDIPVWPHPKGNQRGPSLYPLYPSVPDAAEQDSALYEALALVDAIRAGRARERKLASSMLRERLR